MWWSDGSVARRYSCLGVGIHTRMLVNVLVHTQTCGHLLGLEWVSFLLLLFGFVFVFCLFIYGHRDLELADKTRLSGLPVSSRDLSLPHLNWGYKHCHACSVWDFTARIHVFMLKDPQLSHPLSSDLS